jgi:hypothetical protein
MAAKDKADGGELVVLRPWIAAAKRRLSEPKNN